MQRSVLVTGICCCILAVLSVMPAVPIHCLRPAIRIAGVSFLAGGMLGLSMAGITRVRRPTVIYLLIIAATTTAWPLYHGWPSAFTWDVLDYDGPVNRVITYLETLRPVMYLLGVPFPYAYFGQHGPDPIPARIASEVEPGTPIRDGPDDGPA